MVKNSNPTAPATISISDDDEDYIPVYKRRKMKAQNLLHRRSRLSSTTDVASTVTAKEFRPPLASNKPSLLSEVVQLKRLVKSSPIEHLMQHEMEMIDHLSDRKSLMAVWERAKGICYLDPIPTGWKPPLSVRNLSLKQCETVRKQYNILIEGDNVPPPIKKFKDMRLPEPVLRKLKEKGIVQPTSIQMQGMPVLLSGRDMIGISYTGSGKTLVFVLPLIMVAIQEERLMPIEAGEGPFGLVLCPLRELADQTFQVVEEFLRELRKSGHPEIRAMLCVGGVDMKNQLDLIKKGVHIVVATPGRLKDLLAKKKMNLDNCRYITLDEADTLDSKFEDDIREIFDHFKSQRQTVLFSATMPRKVQDFAKKSLVQPVIMNVGRAGAANPNVIQEVEYVKQEAKPVHLLECLQKTPPPVLIFCEHKADVDSIEEYLHLKGVEVVAVHGGKDQEERDRAVSLFRACKKDVLIAAVAASRGLDFPDIEHVINYDMPASIEDYVHRIGRTGRCGNTGIATTFINRNQSETTLLDLKHLLQEAKQRVPPVLAELDDPMEGGARSGCACCGGLGHRIKDCPKLDQQRRMAIAGSCRDYFGSGGYRGEV